MRLTATRSLNDCLPSTSGRRRVAARSRDPLAGCDRGGTHIRRAWTMFPALNTFHRRHNLSCLIPRRPGMRENNRNRCVYARFYGGAFCPHPTGEGQKELASISICRRRRFPGSKSAQKSDFCEGAFNDYDVGRSPRVTRQPTPPDHA